MKKLISFFILFSLVLGVTTSFAFYAATWRNHATDCTSLTDGKYTHICYEEDSNRYFQCNPTDTTCDTAGEWKLIRGFSRTKSATLFNPNAAFDNDTQFLLWPGVPANITITKLTVTCDASGNEIAGDIKWADAFIGFANATVINVFDTSSGVLVDDTITAGAVAAGKDIYGQFDSQPNVAITQCGFSLDFDYD